MKIDAAIQFMLLTVKFFDLVPFISVSVFMITISISYTTETKTATSSDIFPVDNGPIQMPVGDPENVRARLYTSRSG